LSFAKELKLSALFFRKVNHIIAPEKDEPLMELITNRLIKQIIEPNNKFNNFKIKAQIGKQLFYPATKGILLLPPSVPLASFLEYKVGYKRDVKTAFMNHISFDIAKVLESRLSKLGYKEDNDERVQRASIHFLDNTRKKRFTVSANITSEGTLKLRKYSNESTKHFVLSFTGSKSALDFRFRIISQEPPVTNVPSNLINIINKATCNLNNRTVHLTETDKYKISVVRVKVKRKFFNTNDEFSNGKLKVTISEIKEKGKKDIQVTVTSDALHEILKNMKDTKSNEELKKECKKEVEKFVNELYRLVDGLQYNVTG